MSSEFLKSLFPIGVKAPEDNPYHPFIDIDHNGVIIVSAFALMERTDDGLMFVNLSREFDGTGLTLKVVPERTIVHDFNTPPFQQRVDPEILDVVIRDVERLYTNEIDSLFLRNLPMMDYNQLAGMNVMGEACVQWERKDLDKLIAHIRMLYDNTLKMQ
jgi:hypothetical protein